MRNLYALLVGINFYDDRAFVPPLKGCNNDVKAIQAYLEARTDSEGFRLHLRVLLNQQATRQAVINGFQQHLQQAGADDVVFFYFAGHGAQATAPEAFWAIEPDRLNETLVCYDSRTPDSWDLADKELAKLIADVARANPHIVVVLDCCHSGSGTRQITPTVAVRRAPTDLRQRPVDSFIVSPTEAEQLSASRSPDLNPSGWSLPKGRHIVLSACRDIEEAKEFMGDGQPHGAFSYFLLDTLHKANGPLTYRDVFKRANALIRSRISAQSPQMEATHLDDLDRFFLGGAIAHSPPYYTVSYHRDHGWVIDGGAVHGIAAPRDGESTLLALFPMDASAEQLRQLPTALAEAEVTEVLPQLSKLRLTTHPESLADTTITFKAVVVGLPLPPLAVALEGDDAGVDLVRQMLQGASLREPSLYVQEATVARPGSFRLLARNGEYCITRPTDDRPLVKQIQGYAIDKAIEVVETLEHIARWSTVAELSSPANSRIQGAVQLQLYAGKGDKQTTEEIRDPQIRLSYQYDTARGQWTEPTFRIKLTNTSNETLFCALYDLTERFKVASILTGGTVRLAPGEAAWVMDGQPLYGKVPTTLWQQGITEYKDILKLVACTDEFDPILLAQPDLGEPLPSPTRSISQGNGTLNRLMRRVVTRDIGAQPESNERYDDWVTNQVTFTFVRPQNEQPIQAGAPIALGSGVTVQPHPSLQARTRLTTVSQSTRDIGNHTLPPLLRDQTQSLQFTRSRGTDPGLSALELSGITNLDSVTPETPLIVTADIPLNEDEYILPVAYDGEFFLPLGHGKGQASQTQITIERLPDPVSEGNRSLTGAIRIFFQKVARRKLGKDLSEALGVRYDYPILAAVEVNGEQVTYLPETEQIKEKVAQANTIALFIHGIIGDTESMVPSVETAIVEMNGQAKPLKDAYDLILTFDYESINTSTAINALKLKQRLEDIGLGADHGKTLHIIAHSMGGLLSRWFIEQEGGHNIVQHLMMLGTPNAGSPWPQVQAGLTVAVAFALNGLSTVVWPVKLLGAVLEKIEAIDVPLDEMQPESEFLSDLAAADDPGIPYSIVAGNTSQIEFDEQRATLRQRLMRKLGKTVELPFLGKPNDIAVSVDSIVSVPTPRIPSPTVREVPCNHLVYFKDPAGLAGLGWAVTQARSLNSDPVEKASTPPVALGLLANDSQPEHSATASERSDVGVDVGEQKPHSSAVSGDDSGRIKIVGVLVAVAIAVAGLLLWSRSNAQKPVPSSRIWLPSAHGAIHESVKQA